MRSRSCCLAISSCLFLRRISLSRCSCRSCSSVLTGGRRLFLTLGLSTFFFLASAFLTASSAYPGDRRAIGDRRASGDLTFAAIGDAAGLFAFAVLRLRRLDVSAGLSLDREPPDLSDSLSSFRAAPVRSRLSLRSRLARGGIFLPPTSARRVRGTARFGKNSLWSLTSDLAMGATWSRKEGTSDRSSQTRATMSSTSTRFISDWGRSSSSQRSSPYKRSVHVMNWENATRMYLTR